MKKINFTILTLVIIIFCTWLAKAQGNIKRAPVDTLWKDGTSNTGFWDNPNIQIQIAIPNKKIEITSRTLPIIIWFRNNTGSPIEFQAQRPYFSPHGSITMLNGNGENIISCDCKKKHIYDKVIIRPKEIQEFYCDIFSQWCCRLNRNKLKPGKYIVQYSNSKRNKNHSRIIKNANKKIHLTFSAAKAG